MVTSLWNALVTVSDVVPPAVWLAAAITLAVTAIRLAARPDTRRPGPQGPVRRRL